MSEHLRIEATDGLLRITLDRPPLNVLTTAMLRGLADALAGVASDDAVRVVRLDARGKSFSAGVDVGDHEGDKVRSMMDALETLFVAFDRVPVPVASVVRGAVLGGGLELVLGGDLCIAARSARFGQPEVKLGLFAPPATVLLPRLVGERVAADLLLTGRTVAAEEALALGLVNRVVDDDALEEQAATLVDGLLSCSGAALRHAKAALRAARGGAVTEAHRRVNRLYLEELMATADAHEGLRAFMEKRAPRWTHR